MKTNAQHRADLMADLSDKRHGTRRGVELGCKCYLCYSKREEINYERRKADRAKAAEKIAKTKDKRTNPKVTRKIAKDVCTVAAMYLPMMGKPSIDNADRVCCVCGKPATNKHHIVKRSAGKLVRDGREVAKPTVRLCGCGNASGCHGLAHAGKLHFRWADTVSNADKDIIKLVGGHWEYMLTDEPTKYINALTMCGWRRL